MQNHKPKSQSRNLKIKGFLLAIFYCPFQLHQHIYDHKLEVCIQAGLLPSPTFHFHYDSDMFSFLPHHCLDLHCSIQ